MGVRSLGNALASFGYKFGTTGFEAARAVASGPISATGGDTTFTAGGYKYHAFTSTGPATFTITAGKGDVQYLIVGGGGATGQSGGGGAGGGGAGGLLNSTVPDVQPGPYPVVVGEGGTFSNPSTTPGQDSKYNTFIAAGGGRGGLYSPGGPEGSGYKDAHKGGSGGGAVASNSGALGAGNQYGPISPLEPASAPGQGNDGGPGLPSPGNNTGGGGGGGAGGAGGGPNVPGGIAGAGGVGVAVPWVPPSYGTPGPSSGRWFAGGGGGGGQDLNGAPGGAGGGGAGKTRPPGASGDAGTTNTGGGAGGPGNAPGANGGPGIVILRYLT